MKWARISEIEERIDGVVDEKSVHSSEAFRTNLRTLEEELETLTNGESEKSS